jgi:hypothetical protein
MALGADRRQLRSSAVAAGWRLAVIGIIAGSIAAKLTFGAATRFVPQLEMRDMGSLAAIALLLLTWPLSRRVTGANPRSLCPSGRG